MDPEIKRKLDEQLASGLVSVEDYKRKSKALIEADAFLAGQVVNDTQAVASEGPALGWAEMWTSLREKLHAQWREWERQWNESRFRRVGSLSGSLFWIVAPVCVWILRLSVKALG